MTSFIRSCCAWQNNECLHFVNVSCTDTGYWLTNNQFPVRNLFYVCKIWLRKLYTMTLKDNWKCLRGECKYRVIIEVIFVSIDLFYFRGPKLHNIVIKDHSE